MYRRYFKRIIDILVSAIGMIIFSPLFLFLFLLLSIVNKGGGAFFIQERPGRKGKCFKLIKFKTMTDEKDSSGDLLPDKVRFTKTGKFIRATSLDEIPQLINVLKGDMSLIGPRPLLIEYLPLYSKEQQRRHEVRPGITGWAQVNGRNTISWEDKFKYDVWYIDNISFCLDIKIFFMTIKKVIFSEGINNSKQNTMDAFKGSK